MNCGRKNLYPHSQINARAIYTDKHARALHTHKEGHYYAWAGSAMLMSMSLAFIREKKYLAWLDVEKSWMLSPNFMTKLLLSTVSKPFASGMAFMRGVTSIYRPPFFPIYIHLFALMKFRLSLRQTQNITHYEHPIRWNVDTHGCSHIISVIKAWKLQHCISPHLSFYFYFKLCQCPYLQPCDWLQHTAIYYLIYVKDLNNKWPIKTLSFWF